MSPNTASVTVCFSLRTAVSLPCLRPRVHVRAEPRVPFSSQVNDLSVRHFRIDPEFMWIRKLEVKAAETVWTTQLKEDRNIVRGACVARRVLLQPQCPLPCRCRNWTR